ncbi:unnamed protein product [Notodromas monacha]|uniref:glycylpeptide N-tetradecanoyltransferase n=1 Tax=Notodromas monacha TaxID=399045 RepID=A0A7R9BBT1_9CRUS|nr:unnamed protein product [Notodromas monacha]CAG0912402.1 unnamed protein product [Notodromas monacha]
MSNVVLEDPDRATEADAEEDADEKPKNSRKKKKTKRSRKPSQGISDGVDGSPEDCSDKGSPDVKDGAAGDDSQDKSGAADGAADLAEVLQTACSVLKISDQKMISDWKSFEVDQFGPPKEHLFWNTQPVPKITEKVDECGKLRSRRVAPVLIKEITRRVNLKGIFQAIYTAGVVIPKPFSVCRYWHRSLNPKKLIDVQFSHLGRNMTLQRTIKLYRLPEDTKTPGFREMKAADIAPARKLLQEYLKKFDLSPTYDENEFRHWFMPRTDIINSFVVENDKGEITDFVSFYTLPSTVMHHPTYNSLKAAYSFYNVSTVTPWPDLMQDALITAKKLGFDVFNALDLMDNEAFLEKLKFGIGDGNLHYYLFNYKCPGNHYDLFPRALGEILTKSSVEEVHLSLTKGLWRTSQWGYSSRPAPNGAQLWAWFEPSVNVSQVDNKWVELTDALAGLMCASLRAVGFDTITPKASFRPTADSLKIGENPHLIRYSSLPRETFCTENLTPWAKILPCDVKSGIGSLLHAAHLFESAYHSLAIDFVRNPRDGDSSKIWLSFSFSVVHSSLLLNNNAMKTWSLKSLFGTIPTSSCDVAASSKILVDSDFDPMGDFILAPPPSSVSTMHGRKIAVYELVNMLRTGSDMNIRAAYRDVLDLNAVAGLPAPPLTVSRYITGYGLERGGVKTEIRYAASEENSASLVYLQYFPWYIRVYLHTLKVRIEGVTLEPDEVFFSPGRDRKRPHVIELKLKIPSNKKCTVEIEFERALLKWTEYPPDANHGFYIPAGVIFARVSANSLRPPQFNVSSMIPMSSVEVNDDHAEMIIYTETLLVSLPTPDFSMPYNVICLACTVVALAFGPLHNITTKRLTEVTSDQSQKGIISRLKSFFRKKTESDEVRKVSLDDGVDSEVIEPGSRADD